MKTFALIAGPALTALAVAALALGVDAQAAAWVADHFGLLGGGTMLVLGMAGPVVQSTYTNRISDTPGLPGTWASMAVPRSADSRIVEPSSGLNFGVACGQGTVSDKGVVPGGSLTAFVGISLRDITLADVAVDSIYLDQYVQGDTAAIATHGDIWVTTGGTVVVGAAVYYNATTGVLDDSGGSGPIPGARWMTGVTGAGLAKVRLSGIHRS